MSLVTGCALNWNPEKRKHRIKHMQPLQLDDHPPPENARRELGSHPQFHGEFLCNARLEYPSNKGKSTPPLLIDFWPSETLPPASIPAPHPGTEMQTAAGSRSQALRFAQLYALATDPNPDTAECAWWDLFHEAPNDLTSDWTPYL